MIVLDGLSKRFGDHVVIENLSLRVDKGEFVALLGPTGVGKSTIVNLVLGHFPPTSGTVRVDGLDPRRRDAGLRGRLAVSFQTDRLLPWRTALENVELGLEILGTHRRDRRGAARAWLTRVRLDAAHHAKYPHQLSGGMRQRVSFARALVVEPEIVLLDESFSQLDYATSKVLRSEFGILARQLRKTCLLITHRIEDALELADRVIVLGAAARIALELRIEEGRRHDRAWLARAADSIADAMGHDEAVPAPQDGEQR